MNYTINRKSMPDEYINNADIIEYNVTYVYNKIT